MTSLTNPIKSEDKRMLRRDKARTVEILKRAARETLISKGITGLSIQPILDAAGASRGALFHHFPTKSHLIAAAFADLLSESAAKLHQISAALRSGQIDQATFVRQLRDTFCSDLFVGSMEVALSNRVEPALLALLDDALEKWWASLDAFWNDTFALPETLDAKQHWVMAANLLRGHAFTSIYRSPPGSREAFCTAFETMILSPATIRKAPV